MRFKMGRIGNFFSGVSSKIANRYNKFKSGVAGAYNKSVDMIKTAGHHVWDGIKTTGHVMAEYAPAIGSAVLGGLAEYYAPGSGPAAARAGYAMGKGIKKWHADKWGEKYSKQASTGTGRFVRRVLKTTGKAGKAYITAQGAANGIKAFTKKTKKFKAPPVPSMGGYHSNALR
jgi:hypothetical protein